MDTKISGTNPLTWSVIFVMIPESSSFVPMLDQVKTVQDLINLNDQQPEEPVQPEDEDIAAGFINSILDEEPAVGLAVCANILRALEDFHAQGVNLYIGKNNADVAAQWAHDLAHIKTAREAIKDIIL